MPAGAFTDIAAKPRKARGRGRPWQPGQSGNPTGRPKATPDALALAEAARLLAPEALAEIERLMRRSADDRVRLAAAALILDRAYGKSPQLVAASGFTVERSYASGLPAPDPEREAQAVRLIEAASRESEIDD